MLLIPFWGTTEKIAEIESTQWHIQMHAVIPEMVKSFIVAGGPPKKQIVVSIALDCVYMRSTFSKKNKFRF